MKRLELLRWSGAVLSPRTRKARCSHIHRLASTRSHPLLVSRRQQSTTTPINDVDTLAASPHADLPQSDADLQTTLVLDRRDFHKLPSPPPIAASNSARLAALHSRLSLSPRLPLETLARCLIDPTADPHPDFNNTSLSILGYDLLSAHASELVLCTYPRLPLAILFAAVEARIGSAALSSLAREWGVEHAGAPGGEVDAGLLQYRPTVHPNADPSGTGLLAKDMQDLNKRRNVWPWTPGNSRASILDSFAGDHNNQGPLRPEVEYEERPELRKSDAAAAEAMARGEADSLVAADGTSAVTRVSPREAATGFVRAVFGAVYLHGGRAAAKAFFKAHIAGRKLDVDRLFEFRQPTRDLSRLCAREGFEPPVARILSETGRFSRTPVFVVGVFSGKEKLGEGTGGSLAEARIRACIAALKGWYLYSPVDVKVPSDVEGGGKEWTPVLVDGGEVIV